MHPRTCLVLLSITLFGTTSGWAQGRGSRIQVEAGVGYLTSGDYFTGPSSTTLDNSDAAAVMLQIGLRLQRSLDLVLAGTYAQPDWRLGGVPVLGSVSLPGASLWFGDAALRGRLPLSRSIRPVSLLAQVGAGLARYAVGTSVLGNRIDGSATNFAFVVGAGVQAPLARRLGVELLAKDYIASFKSVRDLEAFGVEGRRAHTILLAGSLRYDL
jgi:opacity protein-like surface antigen